MLVNTPDFSFEMAIDGSVAGLDEVGRGPWAGPVMACAAYFPQKALPETTNHPAIAGLNDSKKLTERKREALFDALQALAADGLFFYGIGEASVEEIDRHNILNATEIAMQRAFASLQNTATTPLQHALIDGNRAFRLPCPVTTVIKGDSRSISIAAASIIAKVTRDRMMATLAREHPHYGWERNAGYGTRAHQDGLALHGITGHHRKSFKPIQAYMMKAQVLEDA